MPTYANYLLNEASCINGQVRNDLTCLIFLYNNNNNTFVNNY